MISTGSIVNIDHFYNETTPGTKGVVTQVFNDEHGNQWVNASVMQKVDNHRFITGKKVYKAFPTNVLTVLKCYVLMLSTHYPAKHPQKGNETHFMAKILTDDKIHTIRANYDLWAKRVKEINDGKAYLSIRQWTGKPYQSKQHEMFQLFKLGIERISMKLKGKESYSIENQNPPYYLFEIAQKDGLKYHDFLQWFFPGLKSGKFEGAILHFTDFRYTDPNKKNKPKTI